MGLWDVFRKPDSRIDTARWADKQFRRMAGRSDREIIHALIQVRYGMLARQHYASAMSAFESGQVRDIFSLCVMITELELLGHLTDEERRTLTIEGENIVVHTHRVVARELVRLGHRWQA